MCRGFVADSGSLQGSGALFAGQNQPKQREEDGGCGRLASMRGEDLAGDFVFAMCVLAFVPCAFLARFSKKTDEAQQTQSPEKKALATGDVRRRRVPRSVGVGGKGEKKRSSQPGPRRDTEQAMAGLDRSKGPETDVLTPRPLEARLVVFGYCTDRSSTSSSYTGPPPSQPGSHEAARWARSRPHLRRALPGPRWRWEQVGDPALAAARPPGL